MELVITHLYGTIMNTYGDVGNILALRYRAERRGIEVKVRVLDQHKDLKPESTDLYFFGGGQDAGQETVAKDLPNIASIVTAEVESGVPLLSICGGYQLLGKSYTAGNGRTLPGIGLLPVETMAGDARMMHNMVVAINPQLPIDRRLSATLVGFENHSGITRLLPGAFPLGRVLKGSGNNGSDGTEGVVYKNAVGTYLHGSCLPKNPHLADWLLSKALEKKYGPIELKPLDDSLEWMAHRRAINLHA